MLETIEQVGIAPLLQTVDWVVIGIFFVMVIGIGLMAARTAGKNTSEFFLGGRGMPWWLLGVSMVACTFSCDTPNLVTDIVRGDDLFAATHVHRLLQHLPGLAVPRYHHHQLLADETGKRLAKRDHARSLGKLREDGLASKMAMLLILPS